MEYKALSGARETDEVNHLILGIVRYIFELMPNISRTNHRSPYNFPKDELEKLYLIDKLSTYRIAKKWKCDPKTVWVYLQRYKIPTRPRKVVKIDSDNLKSLYMSGQSMATIGKSYGICAAAVHRKIHNTKINPRNQWEANIKYVRNDFSGDNQEKAYLIGFRLGDLHVETRKEPDSPIRVSSGTTKEVQLKLMTRLFSPYGHIWISGPHAINEYQFETKLNRSFDFLLPKHKQVPDWIMRRESNFWSFVAGYTDAEGNIGVYTNRARFRIRTYDKQILFQIHLGMQKVRIKSLFTLECKAGISSSGKTKHNQDCWGVVVNHAPSLAILFGQLRSRLLHAKRANDLRIATDNLIKRGYLTSS